jgi:hypothetical protein
MTSTCRNNVQNTEMTIFMLYKMRNSVSKLIFTTNSPNSNGVSRLQSCSRYPKFTNGLTADPPVWNNHVLPTLSDVTSFLISFVTFVFIKHCCSIVLDCFIIQRPSSLSYRPKIHMCIYFISSYVSFLWRPEYFYPTVVTQW